MKLGYLTWYARHAPRICVSGLRASRVLWSLEFLWFGRSWQTAISAPYMWLGSTERTGTASSILNLHRPVVLYLIVMKPHYWSLKNFLRYFQIYLHCWQTEEEYLDVNDGYPSSFSQHKLNDVVRDLSLSKSAAKLLVSRLKDKTSYLTVFNHLLSQQTSRVPQIFLTRQGLCVLYRYWQASTQASSD